ncbi:multicopper oxidase-domain-containing protein [Lasiosphaeris hirsuta]|uniref:Multicopper oxidase-domain-containing protein n=1 Tax=Lasiosphaeris hirsuta TaxID=260670 RepID=A0AA40AGA1_9PEZI|nr:multicopper oxidase-domain-containing protein [Lasiosphaeris hirsuta]
MGLLDICKSVAIYLTALLPSSLPIYDYPSRHDPASWSHLAPESSGGKHYPNFPAPSGPDSDDEFFCKYPALGKHWSSCSSPDDRQCWLKSTDGSVYDIYTDYDAEWPESGMTREYYIEIENKTINADGIENTGGKVVNGSYPGPWIKACWGDLIKVTVKNKLQHNGTTIHWHGFRQLNSTEMDGVNGVTQCPIAPQENFTYTFRATQYGTSWYHSHYSLQYADGIHGPITVFGPSSANYDEGRDPIIVTDWNHRSAFEDWQRELVPKPSFPKMNSVLINGAGNFAGAFNRNKFSMSVEKGKKYLLRIINTSVDTTYIFSFDNHNVTVMTTDFVPIEPYNTSHILVGIGQRYHVILDATPIDNGALSPKGNYWIRAIAADGCKGFEDGNEPDERQGVLRYNATSTDVPTSFRDSGKAFNTTCRDEHFHKLHPMVRWDVTPFELSSLPTKDSKWDVGKVPHPHRPQEGDNFFWWALGAHPLWLNFSDPTLLNLSSTSWKDNYVVVSKDGTADTWVYLIVTGPSGLTVPKGGDRSFFPVAHPMHLHGHDFALLAQGTDADELAKPGAVKLKFDNPPRRDVVLLPTGGYVIIAFKADNPGAWLFHCHIPWHASSGLALQILERQEDLRGIMTEERLAETRRGCRKWDEWVSNPENHYNPKGPFQDDSGI